MRDMNVDLSNIEIEKKAPEGGMVDVMGDRRGGK